MSSDDASIEDPASSSAMERARLANTETTVEVRPLQRRRINFTVGDAVAPKVGDIAKLLGTAPAFKIMPDYDKIVGGLIGFDKVMPDYSKAIASLAGIESIASRITDMGVAGPVSLIDRIAPQYDKALAGLAVIDAVAFQPQHDLLSEATRWEGSARALAKQATQILSAQTSLQRFAENAVGAAPLADLYNTLGQFGLVQAHLGAHAIKPDPLSMLRGATRSAGHLYDAYLEGLPPRPIRRRADVALYGGIAQSGLLVIESLTSEQLTDDDRDELAEQMAPVVELQPWQTGPAQAREELFAALAEIETDLPDWLKAAWEDIERDGMKAASKIAHCVTECIDRTLRAMAPPADVLAWIESVGAKAGWLDGRDNRPTRRAKIMFVMRDRSDRDAKLAVSQAEVLIGFVQDLVQALQTVKHSEAPATAIMRGWVMAAEGALSQLLLHR